MSRQVHLTATKSRMRTGGDCTPSRRENWFDQLNNWLRFLSLQTLFVSDQLWLQPKVTAILRDQVCPSSNKAIVLSFLSLGYLNS